MTTTLAVETRDPSAKKETTTGTLPGVVYGPKQPATPISINERALEKLLKESSESTIITLTGLGEDLEVLIQDMDFDPRRGGVRHIDFYAIERGKELTTNVPLEYIGVAPVEKTGATVNKILHEVEVTCRPSKLPSHIEVDLASLTTDESVITIAHLTIPADVTVTYDADDIVANVSTARSEESEEAGSVNMDAIAVEEKGKGEASEK